MARQSPPPYAFLPLVHCICSTESLSFRGTFSDIMGSLSWGRSDTRTCNDPPTATLVVQTPSLPFLTPTANRTFTPLLLTPSIPTLSNTSVLTLSVVLGTPSPADNPTSTAPDIPTLSIPTLSNTTDATWSPALPATATLVPVTETDVPVTLSEADNRTASLIPATVTLPQSATLSPGLALLCDLAATVTGPQYPHPEEDVWLRAGYVFESACDPPAPDAAVVYTWACEREAPGQGPAQGCALSYDPQAEVLQLGAGALAAGYVYRFRVGVHVADWGQGRGAQAAVAPRLPGLVAVLAPVGELVGAGGDAPLTLDASGSYDPFGPGNATNETDGNYTFAWGACLLADNGTCSATQPDPGPFAYLQSAGDSAVLVWPPDDGSLAGQRWRFAVVYAHADGRSATAGVELEFAAGPVLGATADPRLFIYDDAAAPVLVTTKVDYRGEYVSSGALEVAWSSPTLDVARASASGRTDRLSLALPPGALERPHTLTVTVVAPNGTGNYSEALANRVVVTLPVRRPPVRAAAPPPGCAGVLSLDATDAVLAAGSRVRVAPCYAAIRSPAGLYPLRYRAAVVYAGAEYPIGDVPAAGGVLWRVPLLPAVGAGPHSLRFVLWAYDSSGAAGRFEDANDTLPFSPGPSAGATLVLEAEQLLRSPALPLTDVLHAAALLDAASASQDSAAVAPLAEAAMARIAGELDAAAADVSLRPPLARAVGVLLRARLRANATLDAGFDAFAGRGARALSRLAAAGTTRPTDLVNALAVLLQAAVARVPVVPEFTAASADVHRALSRGLAAGQRLTEFADPPYVRRITEASAPAYERCDSPGGGAGCAFGLTVYRDEPHYLLRPTSAAAGLNVSWGQPPDEGLQRQLEASAAAAWGHVVDLHAAAWQLHAALPVSDAALLPPPGALTRSLSVHAVRGFVSGAPLPVAGLGGGSRVALGFPGVVPGAQCGYWDLNATRWSTAGVETVAGTSETWCYSAHLTAFALALPGVSGAPPASGMSPTGLTVLLFGVAALLVALLCCCWLVLCCYRRRRRRSDVVVHPDVVQVTPGAEFTLTPGPPGMTPGMTPGSPTSTTLVWMPGITLGPTPAEPVEPVCVSPETKSMALRPVADLVEPVCAARDAPATSAPSLQCLLVDLCDDADAVPTVESPPSVSRPDCATAAGAYPGSPVQASPLSAAPPKPADEGLPQWLTFSSALEAMVNADLEDAARHSRAAPSRTAAFSPSQGSAHTNPLVAGAGSPRGPGAPFRRIVYPSLASPRAPVSLGPARPTPAISPEPPAALPHGPPLNPLSQGSAHATPMGASAEVPGTPASPAPAAPFSPLYPSPQTSVLWPTWEAQMQGRMRQ